MTFPGHPTALRIRFIKELLSLKETYWHIPFSLFLLVNDTYDFQRQMAKDEGLDVSPEPWASAVGTASSSWFPPPFFLGQWVHCKDVTQRPPEDPKETAYDAAFPPLPPPTTRN